MWGIFVSLLYVYVGLFFVKICDLMLISFGGVCKWVWVDLMMKLVVSLKFKVMVIGKSILIVYLKVLLNVCVWVFFFYFLVVF